MSSWLKFNEGLNSLKGQISTFANNVLADEEGGEQQTSAPDYEELKKICYQQHQEIQRLRRLEQDNADDNIYENRNGSDGSSWDWGTPETTNTKSSEDDVSHLKKLIKVLESEKNDLISQLEQLDTENQQNLSELLKKKDQIHEENNEIKEKFQVLKQQNIILAKNEETLRRELKELKHTNHTNTLREDFLNNCESLLENHQKIQSELEKTKQELTVLKSTQATLEKTLEDTNINSEKELQSVLDDLKKSEAEKKIIYCELQKAKASEIKSREDTENGEKLALILDIYEKQVSSLKADLEPAQKNCIESKSSSKIFESLEKFNPKLQEELETTLDMVKLLEKENEKIKQDLADLTDKEKLESEELRFLLEEKTREVRHLQEKMEQNIAFKENVTDKITEYDLHKTYVNIITENVKKYIDSNTLHESIYIPSEPHILEFNKQVENIFNILSDLKTKCETLEKQNLELSQEKIHLLTEKNLEIEKLLQNSENLSQDVLRKTEEFKELEEEYEEQRLSNTELEAELRDYKNFKLDTISESNEDNVVLLEGQLENANKKIKEMEKLLKNKNENQLEIIDLGTEKNPIPFKTSDIQKKEEGFCPEEEEVQKTEHDYRELLKMFDDLKIDYDLAQKELKNTKIDLDLTDKENEELRSELDKVKIDFDNTLDNADYQLNEANITIDTLREEVNSSKAEIDKLIKENKKLALLKNEVEKNIVDIKTELNDTREQWLNEENRRRQLETEIRTLTEKLQNAKMFETSLKLQYDTLNKDYNTLAEAKKNMEITYNDTKGSIEEYERNYSELLEKYDGVLLRCEDLNTKIMDNDNKILSQDSQLKRINEKKEDLEKNIRDKGKLLIDLKSKNMELKTLLEEKSQPEKVIEEKNRIITELEIKNQDLQKKLDEKHQQKVNLDESLPTNVKSSKHNLESHETEKSILQVEVSNLKYLLQQSNENIVLLQNQLHELSKSRNEQKVSMQDIGIQFQEIENIAKSQPANVETQKIGLKIKNGGLQKELDKKYQQEILMQDISLKPQETSIVQSHPTDFKISYEKLEDLEKEKLKLIAEISNLHSLLQQGNENIAFLKNQLQELSNSRNELIVMVTTKNEESLSYYNEIQRLTQVLQAETEKCLILESQLAQTKSSTQEIEKLTDQNSFLKEKCDILANNLLEEQSKCQKFVEEKLAPSEKEMNLNKRLERLQSHLMEVEEHYTQELLQAEQQNSELRSKMDALERREKDSSTMYTSVSIRANQQVESLQSQLQMVTNQRDELRKKISDSEDQNSKQAAALANLQFVLEQFQRDREKDIQQETERIRRQINAEKKIQEDLKSEIANLKSQLEESKQGLFAASRLSDQLEFTKSQNVTLREEDFLAWSKHEIGNFLKKTEGRSITSVTQLQEKLAKSENTIHTLTNQTDGKVEKTLVKSLVVGFLSSSNTNAWNKDQVQILKIIATVLDFNQQDYEKVKLNHTQGSWLGSLIFGQPQQNMSQESLSQAFIKFLENESKPRVVPSLLDPSNDANEPQRSSTSSGTTTPSRKNSRTSPIVLSEIVLPSFEDFGRSRNSSSILKDVLKDNSNR